MKKSISFLLIAALLISVMPMMIISVSADAWSDSSYDCVAYAQARFQEIHHFALHNTGGGDAQGYYYNAGSFGDTVASTPAVGALAVWGTGNVDFSHVAIVEAVDGSNVTVTEGGYTEHGEAPHSNRRTFYGDMTIRWNNGTKYQDFLGFVYVAGTNPGGNNPTGYIDDISGGTGSVHVKGWVFDRDDLTKSTYIHVYVGGSLATSDAEGTAILANASRRDVDNAFHVGEFRGFDTTIPTKKTGNVEVYIYAINIGGGSNVELGHKTVYISPDNEKPHGNTPWINCVTRDSFRINIAPTDNVGIKNVRVATWTHNQDDLIWHDALYNGEGVYYLDVQRSDYSANQNSYYNNHFYVYDYAENYISVACNQDYRITSDTGKNIPEGEYRIASAINNNRYLDVAAGSKTSGANIQIYNNYVSPEQTFKISYCGNGFYTIANTHSKCLLDIDGDTYIPGTNVEQCTSNGGANQEWMFKPTEDNDGYYYIIAHSNGLALDVTDALDQNGANVAVTTRNQTKAQRWKLRRVLQDDMLTVKDVTVKSDTDDINPEIAVTVDGEEIAQDGNYQVEITTDLNSGKGIVTVTGIDKYCDSVTKEFTINTAHALLGDANGDDEVDSVDSTIIQRVCTMIRVPFTEEQLMHADVDADGSLTTVDATFIQRYSTHLSTPYKIGEPIA